MQSIESLRRKVASVEDLQSVVKTMKALAAASIRQYERAVESLADYYGTIELGLQAVLKNRPQALAGLEPEGPGRRLALVFGSDYGMAGQFNDLIADRAVQRMAELEAAVGEWTVWGVGERARGRLERRERPAARIFGVPNSVSGITPAVHGVLLEIEDWLSGGPAAQVVLFHNQPQSGSSFQPQERQLLPLDGRWLAELAARPWPTKSWPMFTLEAAELLSALVGQFLFVALYRALAESLASENMSRLAAMQTAERNIAERLNQLRMEYHQVRQNTITEELMDIVSGFEALSRPGA